MAIDRNALTFQFGAKRLDTGMFLIAGEHDAADVESLAAVDIDEAQHVAVIRDAEIGTDFIFFNIPGIHDNDHFSLVRELQQHLKFAGRLKARKYTGRMVIIKKLSAEFKIKLVVKAGNPFADLFGLQFQVFLIVKSCLHI